MSTSSGRLNGQDKRDLEKFTKFLIYRALQIIVQSRLGEKIKTKSRPISSRSDWFNLAIRDNPEVQAEAKKALSGQSSLLGYSVCVEISLKTAEGDVMVLETWSISMNPDLCDTGARVSYTVYNRMGVMLKSLFSVSRVTPAYKLSRRQGACAEDYVICYRIYLGDPYLVHLGEGYQTAKVGAVPTPVGTICINLAYRTSLLISPHKTGKDVLFEVKDDHFKQDTSSPKRPTTPKPCFQGYRRDSTVDMVAVGQEGQDLCATTFSTSPGHTGTAEPMKISGKSSPSDIDDIRAHSAPEKQSFSDYHKVGAFAQPRLVKPEEENVPFLSLLEPTNKLESTVVIDTSPKRAKSTENMDTTITTSTGSLSNKSISSDTSAPDDFVMVELKTPFAGAEANSDLSKFYRECQGAPRLTMCEDESINVNETLEKITNQLSMFESNMKDMDEFVSSLHDSMNE